MSAENMTISCRRQIVTRNINNSTTFFYNDIIATNLLNERENLLYHVMSLIKHKLSKIVR